MKNTLLKHELTEMLQNKQYDVIRQYCEETDPSVSAEFIEALSPEDAGQLLSVIDLEIAEDIIERFSPKYRNVIAKAMDEEHIENSGIKKLLFNSDYVVEEENEEMGVDLEEVSTISSLSKNFPAIKYNQKTNKFLTPANKTIESISVFPIKGEENNKKFWLHIEEPEDEDVEFLENFFPVPEDFFSASLDKNERPRIEIEDNSKLIIFRLPHFEDDESSPEYSTFAIGIILMEGNIITISSESSKIIKDTIKRAKDRVETLRSIILNIFMRTIRMYTHYLQQIDNITNVMQQKVLESTHNKQLIKILNLEKSLVYFNTSLKGNEVLIGRINKLKIFGNDEITEDVLEDIQIECRQAVDMAKIYTDILSNMMNGFANIISNNLNIVMKLLTVITIIPIIPMIISSIYGMNVELPLQHYPHAFGILIGLSILVSVIFTWFLFRKKLI